MLVIISGQDYFVPITCDDLASRYLMGSRKRTLRAFPQCEAVFSGASNRPVVFEADMDGNGINARAALNLTFGASLWLAIFIHVVGVEFYVRRSPLCLNSLSVAPLSNQFCDILDPPDPGRERTPAQCIVPAPSRSRDETHWARRSDSR